MYELLFNIGDRMFRERFFRRLLLILILQVIAGAFLFCMEYLASFFFKGNFFIAQFIDMFLRTGLNSKGFIATPLQNMFLELSNLLLIFLLIWHFRKKVNVSFGKGADSFSYNPQFHEYVISSDNVTIRVPDETMRTVFLFVMVFQFLLNLCLFNFWVYRNQLPQWILVFIVLLACLLALVFLVFISELRSFVRYMLIQSIFVDLERSLMVKRIFDQWLEGTKTITYGDVDDRVMSFIELDIFKTVEKMTLKSIADYKEVRIDISDESLKLYKEELINYQMKSEG